jgi:glycosyltransferase involved in cell wall biosynthesis
MKKVINFVSCYGEGATPVLVEQAAAMFRHSQHQYLFLAGEREQQKGLFRRMEEEELPYAIIEGLDRHEKLRSLVGRLRAHIDRFRPDVLHVHTNWQLLLAVSARRRGRFAYRILYTIHAYRNHLPLRRLIAKNVIGLALKLYADRVIVICSRVGRAFQMIGSKTDVLFEGVDPAFFRNPAPPEFTGTKRLIFAGQFRHGKNQDVLIRAVARYVESTGDADVELYLPGKGSELEACRKLAEKQGLGAKVKFPGYLSKREMLDLYGRCQYAVIPANNETFGMCIAEPYALGRVVISRRVGVAEDVIADGRTGFLFNTEAELVLVLRAILNNREKSEEVSANALANAGRFDWRLLTQQYDAIVAKL